MGKQMTCNLSLRPRIEGVAKLIPAGEAFDEELLDDVTKSIFLKDGTAKYVEEAKPVQEETPETDKRIVLKELKEEALKMYGVELKGAKFNTVEKVQAELVRLEKEASAPKGIFNVPKADIEGFNLDELDAMHADICSKHELPAPAPFESVEQGIAKLTGEAE